MQNLTHIAILAGGNSQRMGTNKARLAFEQKILLSRLVDDAHQLGLQPMLCADDLDYPEVGAFTEYSSDLLENKAGALSAIQPALEKSYLMGEKWLWAYACDSLVRPSELLPYIEKTVYNIHKDTSDDTMMIIPKREKLLPLMGIYRTSLYNPLKQYLLTGNRRVMDFCSQYSIDEIMLPEKFSACCNFNTPQQFEQGKKQYTQYLYEKK